MKYNVEKPEVISNGSLESVEITLGDPNVIFDLLRKQYTYPIQTPVQEGLCNARDSHRKAKQKKRFEVKLPTATYPFFSIRDFGTSMSGDDFVNIWAGMGNSTKRDSNEFTGGFGIGSKAWFAYRNNWFYKIHFDGKVKTYEITTAKIYSGSAELREIADSSEMQGIEVIVPIKPEDAVKFEQAFYRATYFWKEDEKPIVVNRKKEELSEIWLSNEDTLSLNDEITLYPIKTITAFSRNFDKIKDFMLVVDGIPYVVNTSLLNYNIKYDSYHDNKIKEGAKPYQASCDILRTAYLNSEAKVPVFHVKIGEIKLVNHRENIDFSEENVKKVINLIQQSKIKLDKLILTECSTFIKNNEYVKAFDLCNRWQKNWIITDNDSNQYENIFPFPFKYSKNKLSSYANTSTNWSWIETDPALIQNNAIFSYHKIPYKVYQFAHNQPINIGKKSVFVIKDSTEKKDRLIKQKLNLLGIQEFFIINLDLLPKNIQAGFKDLSDNLTFGEWWIKTGLLDSETKKVTKKDSSIISIHFLSKGKRDSVSQTFEKLKEDYRFKNTIFIKMKNNKPDTKISGINDLIDFFKEFNKTNVAMVTEDNYKILSDLMEDDFIDFNDYLENFKNPLKEEMDRLTDLILKAYFWKNYESGEYSFKSIKYKTKAQSKYIKELTLYLMSNEIDLKFTKPIVKAITQFGLKLEQMNNILYEISHPEKNHRKDYKKESSTFSLIFDNEFLKLFPKINDIIYTLEHSYSKIEEHICNKIPFLQYVVSNNRNSYYHSTEERGVEYQIHPIVIDNLKKLEQE